MSFIQQAPREFTRYEIERINRNQLGVYGLFVMGRWIYIGKGDIRQRLLDHLNGDNFNILKFQNIYWVVEIIPNKIEMSNREKQLIVELQPICNQKIG